MYKKRFLPLSSLSVLQKNGKTFTKCRRSPVSYLLSFPEKTVCYSSHAMAFKAWRKACIFSRASAGLRDVAQFLSGSKLPSKKCKTYIGKAVADDLPIPVTDHVKFSHSAFHTVGFLSQMGNFWKNLEWPKPVTSSSYAVMLVNGIAKCSEYYVSESAKRLDEKVNQEVSGLLLLYQACTQHLPKEGYILLSGGG